MIPTLGAYKGESMDEPKIPIAFKGRGFAEKRLNFKSAFLKAYSHWLGLIGTTIAGVSIFNLAVAVFSFEISLAVEALLSGYRVVFHTLFDHLFFWIPIIWEIQISGWVKDLATVWFLGAGTVLRAEFSFRRDQTPADRLIGTRPLPELADTMGYTNSAMIGTILKKSRLSVVALRLKKIGNLLRRGLTLFLLWPAMSLRIAFRGVFRRSERHSKDQLLRLLAQYLATIVVVVFLAATNHGLLLVGR